MQSSDRDPTTPLDALTVPLAAILTGLCDTAVLITMRRDQVRHTSGHCMQFAAAGGFLLCESAVPWWLPDSEPLTDEQLVLLDRLGWNEPDQSGNHWLWLDTHEREHAAPLTVATLHLVHGVTELGDLRISGSRRALRPLEMRGFKLPRPCWAEDHWVHEAIPRLRPCGSLAPRSGGPCGRR